MGEVTDVETGEGASHSTLLKKMSLGTPRFQQLGV